MYDDEFELTFNLQDEDAAPVELPKAAEEKIIDLALHIETLSDMREYTSLLMG